MSQTKVQNGGGDIVLHQLPNEDVEQVQPTFVDVTLDRSFKKLNMSADLTHVMIMIATIAGLLSQQSLNINATKLSKLLTRILSETEINAALYNSRWVWGLAAGGALLSIGSSLAGAGGFAYFTNLTPALDSTTLGGKIQLVAAIQGGGNAGGQFCSQISQFVSQSNTGEREIGNSLIQFLMHLRDKLSESRSSDSRKAMEMIDQLIRIYQTWHDTRMKASGLGVQ